MKFLIISFLVLLPWLFPSRIEAKWWWQGEKIKEQKEVVKESREEIRQEVKEQLEESLGLTGTPSARRGLKNLSKDIFDKLKEEFPFLLPAGINRAVITSLGGSTPPTAINIIKDGKTITLNITSKTLILRKFGGKSNLSELHIGDMVTARGTWEDSEKAVLNTRVLRDLSIQKRHGAFWGKITSIDATGKTFVLETAGRGEQKVFASSGTKIVDRRERNINFSDLAVGHRVRVTGLWDPALKQIDSVRLIKDWSVGPKPSLTPTTTP